jgi:hypothetical protein
VTPDEAAEIIRVQRAVAVMQGSLGGVKELREACLAEDIPAMVYRPPREGGG